MPVERTLPAARAAASAVALALILTACGSAAEYTLLSSQAPDSSRLAIVRLSRCDTGWCQSLLVGPAAGDASELGTLADPDRVTEIAWSPDSQRVAFLVNGHQLRIFDARSLAPAGQIDLVPVDAVPTSRIARGVTFSSNGAAITFDDCPRARSGCRPGIVGIR